MSEWEPATEAEVAMRDALRANDQEQYFRILARTDVLLPISPESSPSSDGGWGTWTTEGRTHVLAFTSPSALHECLAGHPGTHRRVPFQDLAGIWPNVDWWLAVNPGLPIEGYLPSWFVTQISRGDVRLPGRTLGARARIEQASSRTRAVAQVPLRSVPNQPAPTPIERQRMRSDQGGPSGPGQGGFAGPAVPPPPAVPPSAMPPAGTPPFAGIPPTSSPPSSVPPSAGSPYPGAGGYPGSGLPSSPLPPSTVPPRREVPPPDVAPPGAFLPTRADRPVNFERTMGRSSYASPATPPENGAPTSGAPTSGAGAARGRASFPGAGPRGLFDDSDRKSLDVPGERELFSGAERGAPAARTDMPPRPQNPFRQPTPPVGSSGLPSRPLGGGGAPDLPTRPQGGSDLPMRPQQGGADLPMRPRGGSDLPGRPQGGSDLPGWPQGGSDLPGWPQGGSDLPGRPQGGSLGGAEDPNGDPRRYWPRREPARSLGEIYTEHAEPVIPAAWQPPPDLPLASGPPLPTRQPQASRPDADPPAFRPGGTLPQRPPGDALPQRPAGDALPQRPAAAEPPSAFLGSDSLPQRPVSGDPSPFRPVGESLPQRPAQGEPAAYRPAGDALPQRPVSGEPFPQRPVSGEPAAYRPAVDALPQRPVSGEPAPFFSPGLDEDTQPVNPGWTGSADVRPGRPGLAARSGDPFRDDDPAAPLPFDRPVFDRPGFSRLDVEHPEVDETPKPFGGVAAGARSAGFGKADLDDHPFFADEPAPSYDPFAPRQEQESPRDPFAPRQEQEPSRDPFALREEQAPPRDPFAPRQEQEPSRDPFALREEQAPPRDPFAPRQEQESPRDLFAPRQEQEPPQPEVRENREHLFSGRAEVQSAFFQETAEPQRSLFGDPRDPEPPRREEEQRPFFDDEPALRPFDAFDAFADSRPPAAAEPQPRDPYAALADLGPDVAERRDPYAALADLRSDEAEEARQAPEAQPVAETQPVAEVPPAAEIALVVEIPPAAEVPPAPPVEEEDSKENTGSFFLIGAREEKPSTPDPSPELRSFFEDGAAERPDFQQAAAETSWEYEPATYHVEPTREPTREPVYEPEVVEETPVRLREDIVDAEVVTPAKAADFAPANNVERDLFEAVQANSTDRFLSTLLLAKVLIPFWTGDGPVEPANWRTEHMNGLPHLVVFTSPERMRERLGEEAEGSWIKFTRLIRNWPPGDQLAFAINPESPAGAVLPGTEVVQLATWATELGLGVDDPEDQPVEAHREEPKPAPRPTYEPPTDREQVMQKPISPEQLSHYLERNYDRVSGFVHRAGEVAHLETPEQLYNALGLGYAGSSFKPDAEEAYVLRWIAYRGDLYRIPYGGQSHDAMRAMEGWVIERPPFRGNGFAPSETGDVIAEFKVDSARLPHHAELWRVRRDGRQELIARLDADGPLWRKNNL
ncbi:SseB family protein [Dactylosporangium salmoneum]|uniref:SseB protein N-terminal domain-containing protein n=1 Tax=Dactylosporangium salmoneum TaxID=53361 RepID=A0ABN3HQZ2_9ACTN